MPRSPQGLMAGIVARLIANAVRAVDDQTVDQAIRLGATKELWALGLFNGLEGFAEEGSLYIASTVPGTGIVASPATGVAFADTTANLVIVNQDPVRSIHLLAIEELITAIPTASTAKHVAHTVDAIARYGGAATIQGKNPETGTDPVALIGIGAPAILAAGGKKVYLNREIARTQIPVLNDRYVWQFGRREKPTMNGGLTLYQSLASAALLAFDEPPCRIPPGGSYVMNEWSPARSAAESAEFTILYAVR